MFDVDALKGAIEMQVRGNMRLNELRDAAMGAGADGEEALRLAFKFLQIVPEGTSRATVLAAAIALAQVVLIPNEAREKDETNTKVVP